MAYISLMHNILFNYFYRDSGNYKNFSSVIFDNPTGIELSVIEEIIRLKLIDNTWFYAREWGIPNLFFASIDIEADPTWHEFENVEVTTATATHQLPKLLALTSQRIQSPHHP
jgi:hypothetical protein